MKAIHLKTEQDVVTYIELNISSAYSMWRSAIEHDSYVYLGKHENMMYGGKPCHGWVLKVTTLKGGKVAYVGVYVMKDDHRERFILIRNRPPENYYATSTHTKPETAGADAEDPVERCASPGEEADGDNKKQEGCV